jgi:NADP-dependent 3-hydroxy acid dehydrogenase YdfG
MNKTVLITGASSGMGRATAIYLASLGYKVYAGSRTPKKLENLENITALKLDITNQKSINQAIQKIGTIDILINNAGYGLVSTVEEMDEKQMLEQ